jgi:hypothetical protein
MVKELRGTPESLCRVSDLISLCSGSRDVLVGLWNRFEWPAPLFEIAMSLGRRDEMDEIGFRAARGERWGMEGILSPSRRAFDLARREVASSCAALPSVSHSLPSMNTL